MAKKIELKNVSNKVAEEALNKYFENLRDETNNQDSVAVSDE